MIEKRQNFRALVLGRGKLWRIRGARIETVGVVDKTNNHARCAFLIYLRAKFKIHHQFETELEIHPYQLLSTASARVISTVVVVVV